MNRQEIDSIAGELGVEPREVRQMEGRLASRDEAFDGGGEDDDEYASAARFLSDPVGDPADIVEYERQTAGDQHRLARAFECLDERGREIIRSRWLSEEKSTLQDLADRFGISAERVRQLEQNALKKLRKQIAE